MVTSKKFYSLILVLLATALLFSACGDNTATKAPAATTAAAATTVATTTAAAATTVATTAPAATKAATTAATTATKAATTAAASTSNLQFQPFNSPEGGYSVLVPGKPTSIKQPTTLSNPTLNVDLYISYVETPNGNYFVSYNDFPADQVKQRQPQSILNSSRDGQVGTVKGKLLSDKDITQGQIPGKEFEVSGETSGVSVYVRLRLYLAGNRMYSVYALYPLGNQPVKDIQTSSAKDIQTFFDSFKITANGNPAPVSNTTPASSTNDPAAIIDSLKEIEVDPAVLKAVSALPGVTNLDVKMLVGDDTAEKVATSLDQGLLQIGYKFSLPGATKLNKIGASSFGGFYTAAGQPDVLLGATALVSNFDQTAKNLDELDIPGLADSDLQKLFGQLSGKKSLIVVISGKGLEKALFSK